MRTFILRARKATVDAQKFITQVGTDAHVEIIAHTLMNAFYVSNGMRLDTEVYIVLESAADFPRTLRFSPAQGLSFAGFHEQAILEMIASVLKQGKSLAKDERLTLAPGIEILGFGFEVLIKTLWNTGTVYLLDKKGDDIRETTFSEHSIFILSDHLAMPKNNVKSLERQGLQKISLGKKMLFASQGVVLVHNELDRQG